MKDFHSVVQKAIGSMGKAPYDDKETEAILSKETRKTIEYYEKLKESNKNNRVT